MQQLHYAGFTFLIEHHGISLQFVGLLEGIAGVIVDGSLLALYLQSELIYAVAEFEAIVLGIPLGDVCLGACLLHLALLREKHYRHCHAHAP